jgi:CBS domain-containing protein
MKKINILKTLDKQITETHVSEIMIRDVITVKETDTVKKVVDLMANYSISGLMITNEKGFPVGIVSEGDIIKKVFNKNRYPGSVKVSEIMTKHLVTITPSYNLMDTVLLMRKQGISKLPIVENNKLVGYVTKSDLLERLNQIYDENIRLKWLPVLVMLLCIIIAILIMMLVKK